MLEQQKSEITMPTMIKEIILSHPLRALEVMNSTKTITKKEWARALYNQAQGYRARSKEEAAAPGPSGPSRMNSCSDAFSFAK